MTLGRKPEERYPETKPVYEEFQPFSEWAQDPANYILLVQLPGFRKEDVKVLVDNTGRLTIRGTKQLRDNRFARFEKSFTLPTNSNVEKTSGKFEDACLSLFIPKAAAVEPEKEKTEMKVKEKEKTETRVEESGKPTMEEMKELFKEVKEALQREVSERKMEEKRKEVEKKQGSEEHGRDEAGAMQGRAKKKERGRRRLVWEGKEDGWRGQLDRGLVGAMENVRKNRKVIAVALVAFSVGFYVSRRMRTRW
ncbi:hypothetical protein HPP92_011189 [Vanilla planifolia]|uniref:SHSP domain-containing protein n=1 Tax=Vanilla planifolia TaxID=51239 RepID=A0A835R7Y5_VANPL|nr:hypothetical protein HPP92_011189 [Vanilla planifolia]